MLQRAPSPVSERLISLPPDTPPRLHGRWLMLARVGWLAVVIYSFALAVGSIPASYALLQSPCSQSAGVAFSCNSNLPGALDAAGLRALQAAGVSLSVYAAAVIAFNVASALIWAAVGLVIFWRRSEDGLALLGSLALLASAGGLGGITTALVATSPAWTGPVAVSSFLGTSMGALFLFLFPGGRFAPRWTRWVMALYLTYSLLSTFLPVDSPLTTTQWAPALFTLVNAGSYIVLIFSQVYRYRRASTAIERQQVKWAVFGIILSLALVVGLGIATLVLGLNQPGSLGTTALSTLWTLALLPIPVFIGIANLRYRLWDIDTLINKALVYALLTGLLGALYAGLIIGMEGLVGGFTGQASQPLAIVISTLAIAALFQPLRRRIQAVIDRRFYRKKYVAEQTLMAFSAALRQEVDLEHLRAHLIAVVQETMQPVHVSLWLRQPERRFTDQAHRLEPPAERSSRPILD